ncbi:pyrroloquinoline quinone biosynthesis protein B [Kibdelosporangium banguiense]|uniref:Coenzyme PQQ synthesis protein B n=1 Tax=Kibdelosporangium banguiense TaxID=1365924 RepID=A0ABS4TFK9_9PSEU|nr:pyrroloquinoline quinone biosynthesis protein PqqB [Kibdelosporangium banguiense]MBP2323200.1 pyrroloquinoline quinone biosynthesis protein B [Kibdelosporangium banguiense]
MKALLLGTAAGGGFPQWNCACRMCKAGLPPRTQDCIAISADGEGWYLINASPDIRAQILAAKQLAPGPGPRDTPIRGALLTDAELDHTLGLTMLREGAGLRVWAPAAVLHALQHDFPLQEIVSRYGAWNWQPVTSAFEVDGLQVSILPISDKQPKYVRYTVNGPWVVAYKITDPAGGILVYAPCLKTWPPEFDSFIADASCVILDGTFYSPDEMSSTTAKGIDTKAQHAMGHIPIAGPDGSLTHIARHPGKRFLFTHLNNTNPVLDPDSPEHQAVLTGGAEAPPDGIELSI